ncbi:hypothetical protein FOCC_FOCC016354 [Frankliniella occidentalis]|nr:hypothetical protein FOCC_FOCC016354 [Frankliniella occidentalis]
MKRQQHMKKLPSVPDRIRKPNQSRKQQKKTTLYIQKGVFDKVQSYLLLPNIEVDADPLEWWKANQSVFPNLSLVAKHYLGIAGTEAPSERVASTRSVIATPKRTNILYEHLKELAFLHDNLKVPEMK